MRKDLALIAVSLALGGCGGGGGGSNVTEVPFTSFSAIGPNQAVNFTGISQTANGTTATNAITLNPVDTSGTSAKVTYDGQLNITAASFVTPQGSFSYNARNGDSIGCSSGICDFFNASSETVAMDAVALGWNYQTFGIWNRDITATTFQAGAASIGAPTPASAVPLTGNAMFTGFATGFFVDAGGIPYVTTASMNANADFMNRSIGFSTTGTQRAALSGGGGFPDPGLDLSGTFTYSPGTNLFLSNNLTTSNGALNGNGTGRFYGPNAEEIGGIYSLTGSGVTSMLGGFGGKR